MRSSPPSHLGYCNPRNRSTVCSNHRHVRIRNVAAVVTFYSKFINNGSMHALSVIYFLSIQVGHRKRIWPYFTTFQTGNGAKNKVLKLIHEALYDPNHHCKHPTNKPCCLRMPVKILVPFIRQLTCNGGLDKNGNNVKVTMNMLHYQLKWCRLMAWDWR